VNLRVKKGCLWAVVAAGILVAAGCGGGSSGSIGGTPALPAAILTMYSSSVSFGDVALGNATTLGMTFANTGQLPLTLQQNSVSGMGFATSGIGQGVTLSPGQYVTLAVSFAPSVAGPVNGMVSLTSSTTASPINLPLSGNGVVAGHSATVTWNPSTSAVVGYNIYRTLASNEAWSKLNSSPLIATSYSDWDVQAGSSYLYVVTSVSPRDAESAFSNATFSEIPSP
jgi:HYDIN/CFA65/VesB family protein